MKKQYVVLLILVVFKSFIAEGEGIDQKYKDSNLAKIDSLNSLSHQLFQEDPNQSILLGEKALKLSNDIYDQERIAHSLIKIGQAHLAKGEHHTSLNYFYRSLKISRKEEFKPAIVSSLHNLGILYFRLGDYQNSLFYLTESLKVSKEMDDKLNYSSSLIHIGKVYQKLKDYQTAIKYFIEAKDIQEHNKHEGMLIGTYNDIGNLYFETNNHNKATEAYNQSIKISTRLNYKKGLSDAYRGLGLIYESLKDYKSAKENYFQSLQLSIENHEKISVAENYYLLARLAYENKRLEEALDLNYNSYELALNMSAKDMLKDIYELYAKIYARLKDHEGAYSYLVKANNLKEILYNESISRSLSNIQMAEEEVKYRQMLYFKDLEIKAGKDKEKFLTIIIILVILLAGLIYLLYKQKDKQQKELTNKNNKILLQHTEIENQQKILEKNIQQLEEAQLLINEQNQKLKGLNVELDDLVKAKTVELVSTNEKLKIALKELDTFIYKTSHDIRGPLARLMGLCNVALLDIKHKKSIEYFEMLNITANYLNSTLVRLLTVIEIKNNNAVIEEIDFEELITEIRESNSIHEGYGKIRFEIEIDKNIKFDSDRSILNIILHNLLENSIKYYDKYDQPDPFIKLKIQYEDENLRINIIDNGLGINKENLQLFEMFSRASVDAKAAGLGLYMIKVCVDKLGGTIQLLNNPSNYTEFSLVIPDFSEDVKTESMILLD